MKGRHTVTLDELDEWMRRPQWQTFARSFSNVSHKTMEFDGACGGPAVFRVTDHDEIKFLGADKTAAVAAYNNAQ